jgi:hypothetical protein
VVTVPFGNSIAERKALELTYEDTADIFRPRPVMPELTVSVFDDVADNEISVFCNVLMHKDIVCGFSYVSDNSRQTGSRQNIDITAQLFAAPKLRVLPGDKINVRRFGRDNPETAMILTFEVVGQPEVYATHQQINLKEVSIV